jgi:hypothetical protein
MPPVRTVARPVRCYAARGKGVKLMSVMPTLTPNGTHPQPLKNPHPNPSPSAQGEGLAARLSVLPSPHAWGEGSGMRG